MQSDLSGDVAVVTGSSRGIGRAVAEQFAADGAAVVTNARDRDRASTTVEAIREAGGEAVPVGADVSDPDEAAALVETAVDEFGSVDVLVNCAGVTHRAPATAIDPADWKRVFDVNLHGTFYCATAAGRHMREQGRGQVVNVSSMFGEFGVPDRSPYSASKAAVNNLTQSLAVEWAADGVQVNALAPGYVKTEMSAEAQDEVGFDEADVVDRTPMGRFGTTDEIANCATFLARGDHFLTGEVVHPDGGWLAFGWGSES